MIRKSAILVLLAIAHILLLGRTTMEWWTGRDNTLFENGHWVLGKDQGKYVFKTYKFMFEPLKDQQVRLNHFGGHQEILYHKLSSPEQQLESLAFETLIGRSQYLWAEVAKSEEGMLAVRLSRKTDYPSGFYTYDKAGMLISHQPFAPPFDMGNTYDWAKVRISLEDGQWLCHINDRKHGQISAEGFLAGEFGFMGCEQNNPALLVRKIELQFRGADGKTWAESENFKLPKPENRVRNGVFLFAALVILLRFLRNTLLAHTLAEDKRFRFAWCDGILFITFWLICHKTTDRPEVELGNIFLFTEIATLILYAIGKPILELASRSRWMMASAAFGIMALLITGAALVQHGEWMGRKRYKSTAEFAGDHPDSFIHLPAVKTSGDPIDITEPFQVEMSKPWFSGDQVYDHQNIRMTFELATNATFHVVWQQQSFLTHGDPDGEALPLMRRLLQITTRDELQIPNGSGLSTYVERKPYPFIEFSSGTPLYTDQLNALEIQTDNEGVRITLNGVETFVALKKPLGHGKTGILAYDAPLKIHALHIAPTQGQAQAESLSPIMGTLLPVIFSLVGFILLRTAGKLSFKSCFIGGFLAWWAPSAYALGSLFLATDSFAYLGAERQGFVDIVLAAATFGFFFMLVLHRSELKKAAIPGNLIFFLFLLPILVLVYDRHFDETHPTKVKFNEQATAPGVMINNWGLPYYSHNEKIGSNLWIWEQLMDGKVYPTDKPDDGPLRIFFIGGSQGWGSGANSSAETYSELVEKKLAAKGIDVDITNAAINGAGSIQLLAWYEEILRDFKPDIVVGDLGLNDTAQTFGTQDTEHHTNNWRDLIAACQRDGATFVWVREPINPMNALSKWDGLYKDYKKVAIDLKVPICDPYPAFAERESTHALWWDSAHLTPSGQELLAREITPVLEKVIHERRPDPVDGVGGGGGVE